MRVERINTPQQGIRRLWSLPAVKLAAAVAFGVLLHEMGKACFSSKTNLNLIPHEGSRLIEPLGKTAITLGGSWLQPIKPPLENSLPSPQHPLECIQQHLPLI